MNQPRIRALIVSGTSFCIGLGILAYSGPGRPFIRGHVSDFIVVVFLVAVLSVLGIGKTWQRLLAVGVFSIGTELFQLLALVGPDSAWWLHATVGSTFDPVDLLMYGVGLIGAALCEHWVWASEEK